MSRILFLMYHGKGHLNAVLGVANILKKQNYQVTIASHEFFRKHVLEHQLDFRGLKTVPFGLEFEKWSNQVLKKKNIYWHTLKDRWTDRLFNDRVSELTELIEGINPEVVLIDSWQSTDLIVLYQLLKKKNVRVAFIQTMCITEVRQGVPTLDTIFFPENKQEVLQSHRKFFCRRLLTALKQNLYYLGKSNSRAISQKMKEVGMALSYQRIKPALFAPSFGGVAELVLANDKFDFQSPDMPGEKTYVGLQPDLDRNEVGDEAFNEVFSSIVSVQHGRPLIYCSMGTVDYKERDKIARLFQSIAQSITENNWTGIFSGNFTADAIGVRGTANIYCFREVPQLRVLAKASVFITHGGLNSIKEAIYLEVPMIVYPISRDTDHHGNAARVVSSGLGLMGDASRDSTGDVSQKVNELLSVQRYKQHLRELRTYDLNTYQESFVLKVIQNIRPLQ
jgi:zeaxanthin glucosyltransferase